MWIFFIFTLICRRVGVTLPTDLEAFANIEISIAESYFLSP